MWLSSWQQELEFHLQGEQTHIAITNTSEIHGSVLCNWYFTSWLQSSDCGSQFVSGRVKCLWRESGAVCAVVWVFFFFFFWLLLSPRPGSPTGESKWYPLISPMTKVLSGHKVICTIDPAGTRRACSPAELDPVKDGPLFLFLRSRKQSWTERAKEKPFNPSPHLCILYF